METFDDVIEEAGGCGPFQIILFIVAELGLGMFFVPSQMVMMLAAAAPAWSCSEYYNSTSSSVFTGNDSSDTCQLPESCSNVVFEENITTMVTEFGLYCEYSWIPEVLTSVQIAGCLVGSIIYGQLSELIGRKSTLLVACSVGVISGILLALSPSVLLISALLFFNGTTAGAVSVLPFVLVQEFLPAKYRIVFLLNGFSPGLLYYAWLQWYFRDWRQIIMSTNIILIFPVIVFAIFASESARWHFEHGRLEKAQLIVDKMSRSNRTNKQINLEKLAKARNGEKDEKKKQTYSYWDLFRAPELRKHLVAMLISWFVCSHVSYGLMFNVKDLPGSRFTNTFIIALFSNISNWMILLYNAFLGRRANHQLSLLSMAFSLIVVLSAYTWMGSIAALEPYTNNLITYFAFLGFVMSAPAWIVFYLYSSELFPTVVRPLASTAGSFFARIGGMLGPMVLLLGKQNVVVPYVIWIGLLLLNCVVAYYWLPETKNQPMPDAMPQRNTMKHNKQQLLLDSPSNV